MRIDERKGGGGGGGKPPPLNPEDISKKAAKETATIERPNILKRANQRTIETPLQYAEKMRKNAEAFNKNVTDWEAKRVETPEYKKYQAERATRRKLNLKKNPVFGRVKNWWNDITANPPTKYVGEDTNNHYEQVINLIRESLILNEGEARIKRLGKAINKAVKKGDKTKESNLRSAAKSAEAKLDRRDDAGMAKAAKERPDDYSTTHPDRNVRRADLWKKNLDKKWQNNPKLKKSKRHFPKTDSYENMRRHSNNGDRY